MAQNNRQNLKYNFVPPARLPDAPIFNPNNQNGMVTGAASPSPTPFPRTILDLIKGGVDNNLNYGNPSLLNAQQNYTKPQLTQGLQEGKNFGVPQIAQLQNDSSNFHNQFNDSLNRTGKSYQTPSFYDTPQDSNIIPVNNFNAEVSSSPKPSFMDNLKEHPFQTVGNALNSPLGRGLIFGGLGLATGGGIVPALALAGTAGLGRQKAINDLKQQKEMFPELNITNPLDKETLKLYTDRQDKRYDRERQSKLDTATLEEKAVDLETKIFDYEEKITNAPSERIKKKYEALKAKNEVLLKDIDLKYAEQEKKANLTKTKAEADYYNTTKPVLDNLNIEGKQNDNSLYGLKVKKLEEEIKNLTNKNSGGGGKALSIKAVSDITDNDARIRQIDDALKEISAYPKATGLDKSLQPTDILNRTDPKGINARAAIGNMSSMVIKDRSGAAVTVSEFPRLKPFLPQLSDNAETIKKKLIKFKAIVEDEAALYKENLYKAGYDMSKFENNTQPQQNNTIQSIPDGTIQKNKKTGAIRIMRGGQWQNQ